jgi:serine protease Do
MAFAVCSTAGLGICQPSSSTLGVVLPGAGSFLGVGIQEIDGIRAKALKLPEESGVEVTRIAPDSPAEKAGIKTGDVIMQYNGERVEGMDQFSRIVRETPAGRDVKIGIIRNGAPQTITARIVARPVINGQLIPAPGQFSAGEPLEFRFPDMPQNRMTWRSTLLGIDAEALEGQLAEFFGVKEGVLVRAVNKGSAADRAGIKAGDVIVRVDEARVATPADISAHLRGLRGRAVSMVVVRDRKEISVMLSAISRPERSIGALWPGLRLRGVRTRTCSPGASGGLAI